MDWDCIVIINNGLPLIPPLSLYSSLVFLVFKKKKKKSLDQFKIMLLFHFILFAIVL